MRKDIEKLLNSDIATYRINKDFPKLTLFSLYRLRSGQAKIDNITLFTAEQMQKAYKYYSKQNMIK